MIRSLIFLLVVCVSVGLVGCDDKKTVQPRPVKTREAAPERVKPKAEAPQTPAEAPVFVYQAQDRRDPFTSLLTIRETVQEEDEPLTPLQTFGLQELRLIAIILGKNEPTAMVVAPDKKAYTLTIGVKVGRNNGVVKDITATEIIVEERYRDFSGATRTEMKSITLPHGEGE
ncbi:MAG: pilus assembly protein PilP [Desulfuromonadaceae bacterium]|nr:pilus assembly protein PilP [Desulfuromonadaceae bacterium]